MNPFTLCADTSRAPGRRRYRTGALDVVILGTITVGAALVRLPTLGRRPLWLDEATLYWIAQGTIHIVLQANASTNSAPPLFAVLLHIVTRFADSEVALRFLPAAGGILSVPAMYLLARQHGSRRAAVLAAAFVACAPMQITYAQQVREYTLAFLVAVGIWGAAAAYRSRATQAHATALAASFSLGITLQYGLALVVLGIDLAMALDYRTRPDRRRALAGLALVNVAPILTSGMVWSLSLRRQLVSGGFGNGATSSYLASGYWNGRIISLPAFLWSGVKNVASFAFTDIHSLNVVCLLLIAIGLAVMCRSSKGVETVSLFALPWIVFVVAGCLRLYPFIGGRQDIALTVPLYLYAGLALDTVAPWTGARSLVSAGAILLLLVTAVLIPRTISAPAFENAKLLASTFSAERKPSDRLYLYSGVAPTFRYYIRSIHVNDTVGLEDRRQLRAVERQLVPLLASNRRLWLAFGHCYLNECRDLVNFTNSMRRTKLTATTIDGQLYLSAH